MFYSSSKTFYSISSWRIRTKFFNLYLFFLPRRPKAFPSSLRWYQQRQVRKALSKLSNHLKQDIGLDS